MAQAPVGQQLRTALAAVAFLYPVAWLVGSLLSAGPALVRAGLWGHPLGYGQVTWRGVRIVSFPPELAGQVLPGPRQGDRDPWWVAFLLVVLLVLPLLWRARGLAALPAVVAASLALQARMGGPPGPGMQVSWLAAVPLWLLLVVALWRFVGVAGVRSGWGRWVWLLAAWWLPWLALQILTGRVFSFPRFAQTQALPLLAACVVAALPWRREAFSPPPLPWSRVAWGTALSVALCLGLQAWSRAPRAVEAGQAAALASRPYPRLFFQRGVNFTAEGPDGYGSARARDMLAALPKYGVNAIALVPYGFTPQGSPTVRWGGGWESDEGVEATAMEAHRLGLKVLLKPQIWVRPGYPGDLDFATPELRARWFGEYRRFVEHYARLATRIHADVFCVGVEFAKLVRHEAEWRALIARARELYPGPLVYAANFGPEFEGIRFWDSLDYMGLNNYYPLPDDLATAAIVSRVEAVHRRFGKPVLFTEAGFSSFENPHREPWAETPRKLVPEQQAKAYEAVLQGFYRKPWFQGVYWWKVGTNGYGGPRDGSHTPWGKPAMEVVRRWYREGGR